MLAPANVAHLLFESAALSPETFQVVDFAGEERISQLFHFEVNLVSDDPEVDLAAVINQPATLFVLRGLEPVPVRGIIADFQQGGRTADLYAYRAVLVPHLWLLSLSYQSRIFQNMTVQEIVSDVLTQGGVTDFRFELTGSYQPREYCVQYRETDLAFVSRLLEHEGIRFFFEHAERDVLVMMDGLGGSPRIPGEDTVTYNAGGGMVAEAEAVREFICRERVVTGKVVLKDYNYLTPDTTLQSESQINDGMPGLYYEYGQHFRDQSEGDRLAQVRNEEIEGQRRVMFGDSNSPGLRSGHLFTLDGHYRASLDGDYLLTQVRHFGSQGASLPGMGGGGQSVYRNEFTCIPAAVPYRPARVTPVPLIPGIMTARTETTGGDYAYLDEQGRYHAKMHFDLSGVTDGGATRPLRMSQPYSGPNYGIHFPNHADTEMVWSCVDGNPDRPLALGTVPNPSQASPSTSANKPQNVIRTWGQNELTFDDTVDRENIYMHATKDHTVHVVNAQRITVGASRTKSVGYNETNTIQRDRKTTIKKGDDTLTVVEGKREITIKKDQTLTIQQGNNKVDVQTGNNEHVVKGTYNTKSDGAMDIESLSKITIKSVSEIELKVGGSSIKLTPAGIELTALSIKSDASVLNEIKGTLVTINP